MCNWSARDAAGDAANWLESCSCAPGEWTAHDAPTTCGIAGLGQSATLDRFRCSSASAALHLRSRQLQHGISKGLDMLEGTI